VRLPVASIDEVERDPLLRGFCDVRDRDLRGRDGTFIVEGEVVLRVLLGSAVRTRAVLLSEPMAERITIPDEIPTYVAPLPILQGIVGFPIHRGVLALAERWTREASDVLQGPITLGLCGITNHDNVGGIFRNAAAFGCSGALLDGPTCDPLYRKAVRVSVGGTLVVPWAYCKDEREVVEALRGSGHEILALTPRGERVIGRDAPPPGKVALLLGTEGVGLSDDTLSRCTTARIEMASGWDSLNVAVTSGVALHWLRGRLSSAR